MAIQIRRGNYADFNRGKLLPGEPAAVLAADPNTTDGKAMYISFGDGEVKRLVTSGELASYPKTTEVLTRTNTRSFIPTGNYPPATKKYVDDRVAARAGSGGSDNIKVLWEGILYQGRYSTGTAVNLGVEHMPEGKAILLLEFYKQGEGDSNETPLIGDMVMLVSLDRRRGMPSERNISYLTAYLNEAAPSGNEIVTFWMMGSSMNNDTVYITINPVLPGQEANGLVLTRVSAIVPN